MADDNLTPPNSNDLSASSLPASQKAASRIYRDFKEKAIAEKAKALDLGYIDVAKTPINPDLLYLIKPEEAKAALIMPFFRIGKKLRVAVADPNKPETAQILHDLTNKGYLLNINLASDDGIEEALTLYQIKQYKLEAPVQNLVNEDDLKAYEEEIKNLVELKEKLKDMSAEESLNIINVGALKTHASDIHFQPEEKGVLVRFRIDGLLQNIFRLDSKIYENLANQLKYKAGMKINIQNVPQNGRYFFMINDRKIDVRVASLPSPFGDTLSCRLLDSGRKIFTYEQLGFTGALLPLMQKANNLSHGMVLSTGPTGSGKTTTLYSILQNYNTPEKKIITLEDPIEYNIENISQSQINEKRGFTFASGLRSILRHDPDVIMIGEIRDLETAQTASQAALTGHVVLSTLHTNSALETIPRLVNMGLPEFMIAPSLSIIIAQRLVRLICQDCAKEQDISDSERGEIDKILQGIRAVAPEINVNLPGKLKMGQGCDKCSHTGYSGQTVIAEIIIIDEDFKNLILNKQGIKELTAEARRKKILNMEEIGIIKVTEGLTTLEEIHRVTRVI